MPYAQKNIADYYRGKTSPTQVSKFDMSCFVGMIETGEADLADFAAIGGKALSTAVAEAKTQSDKERS